VATIELGGRAAVFDARGDGIPLVFIHQVATDRRIWQYQLAPLAGQYRTVGIDVLGHGEQGWPLEEMSITGAAAHVKRLLEQVILGPAFLVGVSMGAVVAMRCALMAPSMIRGLVLVSPWIRISEHTKSLIDRLFRLAESGDMTAHTELFLRYVFPSPFLERHDPEVERIRAIVMEQDSKAVAYAWAACLASDVDADLGELRIPSLIIAGMNDLFTPPYLAREVAAALVDVELEIWGSSGHFPFLEDAGRFNRKLEMYVRRQSMRTAPEG
jgi:pimeloyl-ACP methyl ester carboxylesterase